MEDFVSIDAEIERRDMHRTAQSVNPTLSSGQGGRYRLWFPQEVKDQLSQLTEDKVKEWVLELKIGSSLDF
jgi:hypothetical protein